MFESSEASGPSKGQRTGCSRHRGNQNILPAAERRLSHLPCADRPENRFRPVPLICLLVAVAEQFVEGGAAEALPQIGMTSALRMLAVEGSIGRNVK